MIKFISDILINENQVFDKAIISVGGLIFNEHNEFLLVHPTGHKQSDWRIPKGEMEHGENEQETALREVFEETGLQCEIIQKIQKSVIYPTSQLKKFGNMKIFKAYVMRTNNPNVKLDWENDVSIWVNESNYRRFLIQKEWPIAEEGIRIWNEQRHINEEFKKQINNEKVGYNIVGMTECKPDKNGMMQCKPTKLKKKSSKK